MASVHKRPNSAYWRAYWRAADGRLRSRSTKFTSRSKALKMALELERTDHRLTDGTLAINQAQRVLVDLARELGQEAALLPSIRAWFEGWLQRRAGKIAEATAFNYGKAIRSLLAHLGAEAERPLPSLTTAKLQGWLDGVTKRGLSTGTARTYTEPILAGCLEAWRTGILQGDPAHGLEIAKVVSAKKDAFTPAEIDALLAAADPEWRIVILLGAYAGLRLGDACGLTWREVDLVAGVLRLDMKKTKREVMIPIHPRLRLEIEKHAGDDPDAALCPSLHGMTSVGSHGTSAQFMRLLKRANITVEQRGTGTRKVSSKSAHSLRHTFVRRLMTQGVDEGVRMRLAGHVSKDAHRVYAQADTDMLRAAIERL